MPYVLDSFKVQGILPSKKLLIEAGWKQQQISTPDRRRLEIPVEKRDS
jgi:hypothetical protein